MMDAAEIPQRVNMEKTPCVSVDGEMQRSSTGWMAAAVSKVLADDDLLVEILLRVGFPTTLVRAALVCKRWYHHVSSPSFLCCFCERYPPRLLGFYIDGGSVWTVGHTAPHFVPMLPQPPELAPVVCRMPTHGFVVHEQIILCRNGTVFTMHRNSNRLALEAHNPLCPDRGMGAVPSLPRAQEPMQQILGAILSKEEEGGLSYLYVLAELIGGTRNFRMSVYMLQDGVWCMQSSATDQIILPLTAPKAEVVGSKIYMLSAFSDEIIVIDLVTSSLSRIPLPHRVKYHPFSTTLSQADDASGVYLTHVHINEHQLCIWLHKGDNWLLVHTICLREMCANLRMLDPTLEHIGGPYLCHIGHNAEFVFSKMCGCMLYLDVTSRILCKLHETA
ncbi:hypothetical protein VPH35_107813 [Triticum aestivum]